MGFLLSMLESIQAIRNPVLDHVFVWITVLAPLLYKKLFSLKTATELAVSGRYAISNFFLNMHLQIVLSRP